MTITVGGALACGPMFYWQLLDDRQATLSEPLSLSFAFIAARLVPPPSDGLKAVELGDGHEPPPIPEDIERREALNGAWDVLLAQPLQTATLLILHKAARSAATADDAHMAGTGLPAAVVTYIAGAVAFRHDKPEVALDRFDAIAQLPAEERRLRDVAAAYMRGRTHVRLGNLRDARSAFQATRTLALAGAPDPMGLAVASLGEEARIDLMMASQSDEESTGDLTIRAVLLYAEQAARGSTLARDSLRIVAARLVADQALLAQVVGDPVVRRLVVAYVTAGNEMTETYEADNAAREQNAATVIGTLLDQRPLPSGEDIDRLAALAYQAGWFEAAERLLDGSDRTIGLWLRAKLALRKGDHGAAVRALTAAVGSLEATSQSANPARLKGELAILRLEAGKYDDALRLLLSTDYWGDAAYVAERVMTADELKSAVDKLPPEGSAGISGLRHLLARRLAREGRASEAIAYFPETLPSYSSDPPVELRRQADAYRVALDGSQPTWRWHAISRAEALFKVAVITRWQNHELIAFEGPPDGGDGVGQSSPRGRSSTGTFLGPDEWKRFLASGPAPDDRLPYRSLAAQRALEAADLLPNGSQAYAAALCWASRDAKLSGDPGWAWRIYLRYVATGAHQPWARAFGGTCPDPDFEAARHYWPKRILQMAKKHVALTAATGLAFALLAAGSVFAIRRRRTG